ncbi:MAG: hypothetical protein AAF830_04585 [Pseudomonadota bacterium]
MELLLMMLSCVVQVVSQGPLEGAAERVVERLRRRTVDPNHEVIRAACYARWKTNGVLLQEAAQAIRDWESENGHYGILSTGRWHTGITAQHALDQKMSKVHKLGLGELIDLDQGAAEALESAYDQLLAQQHGTVEESEKAFAEAALDEVITLGGWDETPPALREAFLDPAHGFAAGFAATLGELIKTEEKRWQRFQKIRTFIAERETHAKLDEINAKLSDEIRELREELKGRDKLIDRFLVRILDDGVPEEKWAEALDGLVHRFRALMQEADQKRNLPRELEKARKEAKAALDADDLDGAEYILRTIRLEWKKHIASEQRQMTTKWAEEQFQLAIIMSEEAVYAAVEDPGRGAALYLEAAHEAPQSRWQDTATWRERAADLLEQRGQIFGDRAALETAVALLKQLRDETNDGLERARLSNNLAINLRYLGERGDDNALRQAVGAYESALIEYTRNKLSLLWAMTQNNLGITLRVLGEYGDDNALRRAVEAFENALLELKREKLPLQWAVTQNNLGSALRVLGERGDDDALRRAVEAYQNALLEHTRDKHPLDWAMAQNNLGNALSVLGKRGDDKALRRAVEAHEDALLEYTRDQLPLDWAMTQNNLGNSLRLLGERGDDETLARAVEAYENALLEWTRDKVPLDWATTQNNLGGALAVLGLRGDDGAWAKSLAAFDNALLEWTEERVPTYHAVTTQNRANLIAEAAERGIVLDGE